MILSIPSHLGHAFVAQWLEHWSCKPGVVSSNLTEGFWADPKNMKLKNGENVAQRGARTHDPEIKSLMLYRLS